MEYEYRLRLMEYGVDEYRLRLQKSGMELYIGHQVYTFETTER